MRRHRRRLLPPDREIGPGAPTRAGRLLPPVTNGNLPGWSLARRARDLHLQTRMVAEDLARIGVRAPADRLTGHDPTPPVVLAGLVHILELDDRVLDDATVMAAVALPWHTTRRRIPAEILTILAAARSLPITHVRALATPRP